MYCIILEKLLFSSLWSKSLSKSDTACSNELVNETTLKMVETYDLYVFLLKKKSCHGAIECINSNM